METNIIQMDFASVTNMQAYEDLRQEIESKNIDVGLLVINAGLLQKGALEDMDPNAVADMMIVNTY